MPAAAMLSNLLLASLDRDDYSILRPNLNQVRLVRHDELQRAGEPIEQVYFPLSGMISLLAIFQTGESVEIAAIGCEGAVGAKSGLQSPLAFSTAVVQLPGLALRIDIESFQRATLQSIGITHLATCANDIASANALQSAGCNAIHGVEARMARWLLHAHDRHDSDCLPLTHDLLAQMLGVRRSTVSVAADALQEAGAIHYQRGQIEVHDRQRLKAKCCECYGAVKSRVAMIGKFSRRASAVPPHETSSIVPERCDEQ